MAAQQRSIEPNTLWGPGTLKHMGFCERTVRKRVQNIKNWNKLPEWEEFSLTRA